MSSTKPITIAIPGEKRNGEQVKRFLLEQKIIQENDMNLEYLPKTSLGDKVRLIQVRAGDAISGLRYRQDFDMVIAGLDQIRESSFGGQEIFDSNNLSRIEYYTLDSDDRCTDDPPDIYKIVCILNSTKLSSLQAIVRFEDKARFPDLESIKKFLLIGDNNRLITPYPQLTGKILYQSRYSGAREVQGKTEALIRAKYGDIGVDIVDTGATLLKNGLISVGTLFESYPAGIVSASQLEQDKRLQDIVRILTDATNNAYYSSSGYRDRNPQV